MATDTARLVDKLRKILALTTSPVEHEAAAALGHLQRLLTEHNLSMADLEKRGGVAAPGVEQRGHDLGKAAFKWKLKLANAIGEFYYCYSMVDEVAKTVAFVGRPDNVESLTMLYTWIIDQIKRIATEERRVYHEANPGSAHIDPLRWQVQFGLGCVERLVDRLREIRDAEARNANTTALVVHHATEVSDWLEAKYGYRVDGRDTARQAANRARWDAKEAEFSALLATDAEAAYRLRPWMRPETPEQIAAREARWAKERAKEERNARRRTGRQGPRIDWVKEEQGQMVRESGRAAGDRVNLTPFLEGRGVRKEVE